MSEEISRRGFLKGAGATAAGATGFAGCSEKENSPDDPELNDVEISYDFDVLDQELLDYESKESIDYSLSYLGDDTRQADLPDGEYTLEYSSRHGFDSVDFAVSGDGTLNVGLGDDHEVTGGVEILDG